MKQIECDALFPQRVWKTTLDLDVKTLTDHVLELEKNDSKGNQLSNINGWQSKSLKSTDLNSGNEPHRMMSKILHVVNSCASSCGISELDFGNYWFNINRRGCMNASHTHPKSVLSGVFYINTNEQDGNIVFERSDNAELYLPEGLNNGNFYTSQTIEYKPSVNTLYIFGSWMRHWVKPNNTNSNRISVSFNTYAK